MWTRCGCHRLLGLCLAIAWGGVSAGRAEAGFADPVSPAPVAVSAEGSASTREFTPRSEFPDLKLDASTRTNPSVAALDLPDAWDFRTGQKSDDHLVSRLVGDSSANKSSYSLFWEDAAPSTVERNIAELGVDVKSANPVVVPLPPGVWAGLGVLGAIAIHQIRRHRRQLA
jgi:hypothetical protein